MENLRAKNNALHVSMEKLLGTNSELAAKFNSQAMRISALEAGLAEAQAQRPAAPAAAQPAGGHLLPDNPPEGHYFLAAKLLRERVCVLRRVLRGAHVGHASELVIIILEQHTWEQLC